MTSTEPKFIVQQETNWTGQYDKIEWGELWAKVYPNGYTSILHQHGGDDWMSFSHDEIPSVIALLIMIYTNTYKKEVQ